MTIKVFIDGSQGTTGLMIQGLMAHFVKAHGIEIMGIADRKDINQRREALNAADVSILCLPDDAAREAVSLVTNPNARILDASSAHRTAPGWVYGFAELTMGQTTLIANASRVTNPGCHAIGAIAILRPLVSSSIIDPYSDQVVINGISGYSGSGKKGIALYSDPAHARDNVINIYGLNRTHKHLPEMKEYSGLVRDPVFLPVEIAQEQGMIVNVPMHFNAPGKLHRIHETLSQRYNREGSFVQVEPLERSARMESINLSRFARAGGNVRDLFPGLIIHVTGEDKSSSGHCVVIAEFDNLGKGAAASTVQNLKLMLGIR